MFNKDRINIHVMSRLYSPIFILIAALILSVNSIAMAQEPKPYDDLTGEGEVSLITHGFIPELKIEIENLLKNSGYKNTIFTRVPKGESCVEASRDRAKGIAAIVKQMKSGKKSALYHGYEVKIGYKAGYGGAHTYTVVEIYDSKTGKYSTLEVDDYLGRPTLLWSNERVNWDDNYTHHVWGTQPQQPQQSKPKSQLFPKTPEFEKCVESEKKQYESGINWFPKIRDKNSFSKFSCQPMHSSQESPSKQCCGTYYSTRNKPSMWDESWYVLQECGWREEIKKRKETYYKKAELCRQKYPQKAVEAPQLGAPFPVQGVNPPTESAAPVKAQKTTGMQAGAKVIFVQNGKVQEGKVVKVYDNKFTVLTVPQNVVVNMRTSEIRKVRDTKKRAAYGMPIFEFIRKDGQTIQGWTSEYVRFDIDLGIQGIKKDVRISSVESIEVVGGSAEELFQPKESLEIHNIKTARQIAFGRPAGVTSVFLPEDNPIYLYFNFKGINLGAEIKTAWYYLETESPLNIGGNTVVLKQGMGDYVQFSFELAQGKKWPTGKYRIDIYVDGKKIAESIFSVSK